MTTVPQTFFICLTIAISQCQTLVEIEQGEVQGYEDSGIRKFIGIPFAKPPVGDLRFAPPEEANDFDGIFEATAAFDEVPSCPQNPGFFGIPSNTEDCLYLSIFAPLTTDEPKPVLFWIYGGTFERGSIAIYDFTNWISDNEDVIVVEANYRVGVLGTLFDNEFGTGLNGNQGFLDQKMAIDWVYKNIEYFGGDPNRIVLFGQSAGAHYTALHSLYNNEQISGAIMLSGSFPSPMRDPDSWNDVAVQFSNLIGCGDEEMGQGMLDCWRNVDVDTVLEAQGTEGAFITEWPYSPLIWSPTVLTSLLPNQPVFAFEDANLKHLGVPPIIIGNVEDEFFAFAQTLGNQTQFDQIGFGALFQSIDNVIQDQAVTLEVLSFYGIDQTTSLTSSYFMDLLEIFSDNWHCNIRNIANNAAAQLEEKEVFYYNFDYINPTVSSVLFAPVPECQSRACHSIDVFYDINAPDVGPLFQEAGAEAIGPNIQRLFTNFAANGNPNCFPDSISQIWPSLTNDDQPNFLRINGTTFEDGFFAQSTASSATRTDTNAVSSSPELCPFWDTIGYLYNTQGGSSSKSRKKKQKKKKKKKQSMSSSEESEIFAHAMAEDIRFDQMEPQTDVMVRLNSKDLVIVGLVLANAIVLCVSGYLYCKDKTKKVRYAVVDSFPSDNDLI